MEVQLYEEYDGRLGARVYKQRIVNTTPEEFAEILKVPLEVAIECLTCKSNQILSNEARDALGRAFHMCRM